MKRVLVVGWCLPSDLLDGASLFISKLVKFYQAQGHYVEIFTIARPEKMAFLGPVSPWKIYTQMARGVRHNVLVRPWGVLYTNPLDPMSSVHEPRTSGIWMDFLKSSGPWDVVHFNTENPLEIIELTRKVVPRIRYSFHNFYLLFPIEQLFSERKFKENPYQDLTISDYTGESAVSEYEAMGTLPAMSETRRAELVRQFDERMQYGRFLLAEVIDEVLGASAPHIIFVREVFKAAYPNVILTDFALSNENGGSADRTLLEDLQERYRKIEHAAEKFKLKYWNRSKLIFGVYGNVTRYKGQHVIIKAVENLRDCAGEFEVRFYGHTNFDPQYTNFLSCLVEESDFLKKHVRIMGGYQLADMPRITDETLVALGCSATDIGSSGGIYDALAEGNLPVFVMDYTLRRELRLVEQIVHPSDLEPLRLFYPCGNSDALAGIMRAMIAGEIDIAEWFQKSLETLFIGKTITSNFKKVWDI
ncbi:MAG: hypothetical protein AB9866_25900 [Syntrophobacteraceae bacterium]